MQQVETGKNSCLRHESTEKVGSALSAIQLIHALTAREVDMPDAIQELARCTRRLQKGSAWQKGGRELSGLHAMCNTLICGRAGATKRERI